MKKNEKYRQVYFTWVFNNSLDSVLFLLAIALIIGIRVDGLNCIFFSMCVCDNAGGCDCLSIISFLFCLKWML